MKKTDVEIPAIVVAVSNGPSCENFGMMMSKSKDDEKEEEDLKVGRVELET